MAEANNNVQTVSRSQVVKMLADVASQGRYDLKPEGARRMNLVFDLAAQLINELEEEEKRNAEAETANQQAQQAEDDNSE